MKTAGMDKSSNSRNPLHSRESEIKVLGLCMRLLVTTWPHHDPNKPNAFNLFSANTV
jgi:hypothetical protein